MPSPTSSQIVFLTCQPGAERPLKTELAAYAGEWRLAFSRPGFVSFKCEQSIGAILAARMPTFARTLSISLSKLAGAILPEAGNRFWQLEGLAELVTAQETVALHVWQRETILPGEDHYEPTLSKAAIDAREAILQASDRVEWLAKGTLVQGNVAPSDSLVLDVVLVESDEWVVGWHRASARQQRWTGGMLPVAAPTDMVSRAYLKMEEALKWSALPTARGDTWIELGCAPGGASQSLLNRGFAVIGVDPAEVDPTVTQHPAFIHLRKRSNEVRRVDFAPAKWLAADLNVAPKFTLDAVEDVVTHSSTSIRGLVMTLKLADWELATPEMLSCYLERVQSWGFRDVRLRQLVHNRQEICLVALHSRGQRRMKRSRHGSNSKTTEEKPTNADVRFDGPTRMAPPHHFR